MILAVVHIYTAGGWGTWEWGAQVLWIWNTAPFHSCIKGSVKCDLYPYKCTFWETIRAITMSLRILSYCNPDPSQPMLQFLKRSTSAGVRAWKQKSKLKIPASFWLMNRFSSSVSAFQHSYRANPYPAHRLFPLELTLGVRLGGVAASSSLVQDH